MKSIKKFNLDEKLKNLNFDVLSKFKYFILAPAVILLVGMILFSIFGFAKSIDFTVGYVAKVYIGQEYTYEDAEEKVDFVLQANGVRASLYQKTEEENENYITVKYQQVSSLTDTQMQELNNELIADLFTEFEYDKEDIQEATYVVGNQRIDASLGKQALVNAFSVIVVASVLMFLYFLIRFGQHSAMTTLLAVYHDLLIAMAIAAIVRIEINMAFLSALVAIFVYSFVNNALFFTKIKRNSEEKLPAKQIANQTGKEHLHLELIMTWFVLIMLVLFSVIGVPSVLPFTIITIFGVLASFYSTTFLVPTLWAFVYVPAKKKPKIENNSKEIV